MQIQLVRNATLRLSLGGVTFLIDPWLAAKGQGESYAGQESSPLVDLPMPIAEIIDGVDAVIVSHLHSDHFDEVAQQTLPKAIPLLCHPRDAEAIRATGFLDVRPIEAGFEFAAVSIATMDGQHGPEEVLEDMGEVTGFVFRTAGEPVLYWAGDTILYPAVERVIAEEQPEVIVVHACGAMWIGQGPIVMDAEMALQTARLSGTAKVVTTHLEAVDHGVIDRAALKAAAAADPVVGARIKIPADGETLVF